MPESLDNIFDSAVAEIGGAVTKVSGGAGDLFMEILNLTDLSVWMCLEPVTKEQYEAISPAPPWMKSGYAAASMDKAAFAHSPDKPDEFSKTECDGLVFRHVATPMNVDPSIYQSTGPKKVMVNKRHLLGFDVGREITVMDHDGEIFIELIGTSENDAELELPEGARLRKVTLEEPIVVQLPTPTVTHFWFGGQGRSFQGPIDLPQLRA